MKKICLITSHLMSGSSILFDILDQNPRIQGFRQIEPYTDIHSIMRLTQKRHKLNNQAAIYMDELLFNYFLQTKDAYKYCKFIYVLREPVPTLNALVASNLYKAETAVRYYCYRLQRICEMAKRTPGAVFLTWDDMLTGRGLPLVENYLNLKQPLQNTPRTFEEMKKGINTNLISFDLLQHAEQSYERYFHFLLHQQLMFFK